MADICAEGLLHLLQATVTAGLLILIMLVFSRLFRKRYAMAGKQLLWILLALWMLVPFRFSGSLFQINLIEWHVGDPAGEIWKHHLVQTGAGLSKDAQKETSRVYASMQDEELASTAVRGYLDTEVLQRFQDQGLLKGYLSNYRNYIDFDTPERLDYLLRFGDVVPEEISEEESSTFFSRVQKGVVWIAEFVRQHIVLISVVWLAGFLLFWGIHLAVWLGFRKRLRANGREAEDAFYLQVLAEAAAAMDLKKQPKLYLYRSRETDAASKLSVDSPMVTGVFHPVVWLPEEEYSEALLEAVLCHELTHISHKDLLVKWIYLAANSVHWFNPLAWLMVRQACRDMELYCDAEVLAKKSGEERAAYNEQLYSLLKAGQSSLRRQYFSTCYSGNIRDMKQRFLNNLDEKRKRYGWAPAVGLAVLLLLSGLSVKVTASTLRFSLKDAQEADASDTDEDVSDGNSYASAMDSFGWTGEEAKASEYFEWGSVIPHRMPEEMEDAEGCYAVPIYGEDYDGNVSVYYYKIPREGKKLEAPPEVTIISGAETIRDYAVCADAYPTAETTFPQDSRVVQDAGSFFAAQAAKGEENPLFVLPPAHSFGPVQQVLLLFPEGEMPDMVNVREIVLNEDGTSRFSGRVGEVVYRVASPDASINCVQFHLANHSAIQLYEDNQNKGKPFLRGFQVQCDWIQENGAYSCTYLFVLRTQALY